MKIENGEIYFGQEAIDACPDGWTCAIYGEVHMPDEEGYYVYITERGCVEYPEAYGEHTLVCPVCGEILGGEGPAIEIECLNCLEKRLTNIPV